MTRRDLFYLSGRLVLTVTNIVIFLQYCLLTVTFDFAIVVTRVTNTRYQRVSNLSAKRITSQDVAKRAGVSRTTVSLVLNNVAGAQISQETRHRVIEMARVLGYVPDAAAQALASRRAQTIGLILTRSPRHIASDAFITQTLNGLIEVIHQQGMRLLFDIVETQHQKEAYLQLVRAKQIEGVLLSGPLFDDQALQALEETGFPTVLIGQIPESDFCSVDVDNFSSAKSAVAHLLRLGHSRIACITNAPAIYTAAAERLRGYKAALQAGGLPYDNDLVRYGDFDAQSGYEQMNELLDSKPLPSAVFVASDVVAFGAMAAIREHGLAIPHDMALVGFDDIPFARFVDPPLTTVHLPALDLAIKSSEMLFQLIRRESPVERHILLATQLVIRRSCGATGY